MELVARIVSAFAVAGVFLLSFHAAVWGDESMIAGAKKEGQLVWYTTTSPPDSKALLDAFMKKYPFVKAQSIRSGAPELVEKFFSRDAPGNTLPTLFGCLISTSSGSNGRISLPAISRLPPRNFLPAMKDPAGLLDDG